MTKALEAERRPVGRPRTPAAEAYSEVVVVRLTPAQKAALRALVARQGHCPLGVYARQLLVAQVATAQREEEV